MACDVEDRGCIQADDISPGATLSRTVSLKPHSFLFYLLGGEATAHHLFLCRLSGGDDELVYLVAVIVQLAAMVSPS